MNLIQRYKEQTIDIRDVKRGDILVISEVLYLKSLNKAHVGDQVTMVCADNHCLENCDLHTHCKRRMLTFNFKDRPNEYCFSCFVKLRTIDGRQVV